MNQAIVHENLRWFLSAQRQGTHSAKTRSEVSGGGIKPWKQKGTGRARAGSIRSPLWRKGGVIFPPKPRDYSYCLPKKMRKLGLRVALSDFKRENKIKVVDGIALKEGKTKSGVLYLKELGVSGSVLMVLAADNQAAERGLRNIAGVKLVISKDLNIFDLLKSEVVVLEKKAVSQLEERLG